MFTLKVQSNGVLIINKTLTKQECESVDGFGAQWICNAFIDFIGLDISDYTIIEYVNNKNEFIVNIRQEDLVKLRSSKLDKLV